MFDQKEHLAVVNEQIIAFVYLNFKQLAFL
jgi:hypothetical protein